MASTAFLLVNLAAPAFDLVGPSPAFAKNDNGGGNGGGNSGGNGGGSSHGGGGGSGGSSNSGHGGGSSGNSNSSHGSNSANTTSPSATGPGKSASAPGQQKSVSPTVASAANPQGLSLDAMVAGLHAAHANLEAFIHANPNSKVGELAVYAKAVVAVEAAGAAVQDATNKVTDATTQVADATTQVADATTALNNATDTYNQDVQGLIDNYDLVNNFGLADTSAASLQALLDSGQVADLDEFAAIEQTITDAGLVDQAQTTLNNDNQALIDANQARLMPTTR